ncbi:hypothetical protein DRP05_09940 [Archaeoglobales archaeon]|nr:MAG: hypothetical protein DRP05_09940 [Archaeoglobales archaeon]
MGHKGDIEHVYTLNKHTLPEDIERDIRQSYSLTVPLLETFSSECDKEIEKSEKPKQMVVTADEVEGLINSGEYEFVTVLPNNKVVIKSIKN